MKLIRVLLTMLACIYIWGNAGALAAAPALRVGIPMVMRFLVMDSPSPVPPKCWAMEAFSCSKGSKSLFWNPESMGQPKGRYDIISPNNHANMAQSTNDAFPTGIKVCVSTKSKKLVQALNRLAEELDRKAVEFKDILKMGRTHLQDAVPISLGQEMGSYASSVRRGIRRIEKAVEGLHGRRWR